MVNMKMQLTSPVIGIDRNEAIPKKYTCDGESVNPPFTISNIPEGTASFAFIMEDIDVSHTVRIDGKWEHWLVWNIPPETTVIADGVPPHGVFGMNTNGTLGYDSPCPPDGTHRYVFKLFALKKMLDLPEGASKQELLSAMEMKILDQAELIGTYYRQ